MSFTSFARSSYRPQILYIPFFCGEPVINFILYRFENKKTSVRLEVESEQRCFHPKSSVACPSWRLAKEAGLWTDRGDVGTIKQDS